MDMRFDFKTSSPRLYEKSDTPKILHIPQTSYLSLKGKGRYKSKQFFKELMTLYDFSFSLKMIKLQENCPKEYKDYVLAPLEGLFQTPLFHRLDREIQWYFLMRQPTFLYPEIVEEVKRKEQEKRKPGAHLLNQLSFLHLPKREVVQIVYQQNEPLDCRLKEVYDYLKEKRKKIDFSFQFLRHELYTSRSLEYYAKTGKILLRYPICDEKK